MLQDAHAALNQLTLERRPKQFDFIVVDIDDSPLSSQDVSNAYDLLKPGGLMLQNWNDNHLSHTEDQLDYLHRTLQNVNVHHLESNSVITSRKLSNALQHEAAAT